jgi:hypothetical protein
MSSSRPETDPAADEDDAPDKSEGVEGTIAAAGRPSTPSLLSGASSSSAAGSVSGLELDIASTPEPAAGSDM